MGETKEVALGLFDVCFFIALIFEQMQLHKAEQLGFGFDVFL